MVSLAVARGGEPAAAGEVELPVDRRRQRHALLRALRRQPAAEVRLVPDRPEAHARQAVVVAGVAAPDGLGEEAELLGARAVDAVARGLSPLLDGPVRRSVADHEVRRHAARHDRLDECVVGAEVVAGGIGRVEPGGLGAHARGDLVPVELRLDHVGAQRGHLVERLVAHGAAGAEQQGVVLHDRHLPAAGMRGRGPRRENGKRQCAREDVPQGTGHELKSLAASRGASRLRFLEHVPRARVAPGAAMNV